MKTLGSSHQNSFKFLSSIILFTSVACGEVLANEIVPFGSEWEWFHPTDARNPAEEDPDFNSTWFQSEHYDGPEFRGPSKALLGYGAIDWGEIATDIGEPMAGDRFSAYFRAQFEVSREQRDLLVDLLADDGGVLFIDGVEVARVNSSGSGGYQEFTDTVGPESHTVTLELEQSLKAGRHEIAFALHNTSATSSDLGFDLRLRTAPLILLGKTVQRGPEVTVTASSFSEKRGETMDVDWAVQFHGAAGMLDKETGFGQPQDVVLDMKMTEAVTEIRLIVNDEVVQVIGRDRDGDGMDDAFENAQGLDPDDPTDGTLDRDEDGLTNVEEFERKTEMDNPDTDGDGLTDGVETETGIWVSAQDTGTDPLDPDSDGDALSDGVENPDLDYLDAGQTGSDPNLGDSDLDGFEDGWEIAEGKDPSDPRSRPASGTSFFGPHEGRFLEFFGPDDLHLDPKAHLIAVDFNGTEDRLVNGVLFQADGRTAGPTSVTNPRSGVSVSSSAANIFDFEVIPAFTGADQESVDNLAAMMRDTRWEPSSTPIMLDIGGLEPGTLYEIQWLMNEAQPRSRYFDVAVEGELIIDNGTSQGEAPDREGRGGQIWKANNSFAYVGNFEAPLDGELNFVIQHQLGGEEPGGTATEVGLWAMIVHELAPRSFQITDIQRQSDRRLDIRWDSTSGVVYAIEASTDLQTWHQLANGIGSQGRETSVTIDFETPTGPAQYYRVRETALLYEDFEDGAEDWISETISGDTSWEWGDPADSLSLRAHEGNHFWGTRLDAPYGPNAVASLRSPLVDLGTVEHAVSLTFRYHIDTVKDLEGGVVRVLGEAGEELYSHMPPFTGRTSVWKTFRLELPDAVQNEKVMIEFLFQSDDDESVGMGWYVDDVVIR